MHVWEVSRSSGVFGFSFLLPYRGLPLLLYTAKRLISELTIILLWIFRFHERKQNTSDALLHAAVLKKHITVSTIGTVNRTTVKKKFLQALRNCFFKRYYHTSGFFHLHEEETACSLASSPFLFGWYMGLWITEWSKKNEKQVYSWLNSRWMKIRWSIVRIV